MTLKQLEVFAAIAKAGSFSRGAGKVEITQSTASQHIQELEKELGIKLFDRSKTGALLTVAGKLLLARAKRILAECEESREAIRCFIGMDGVTLSIGASSTASLAISKILADFIKDFPGVRVELREGHSNLIIKQLLNEEIEIGYIGSELEDERIKLIYRGEEAILFVTSQAFVGGKKYSISQGELCKVPMVVLEDGSGAQKAVYDALARTWINKDALKIVARFNSNEAVKRAVINGVGYAFLPESAVIGELKSGLLEIIRIPGVTISRKLYAVCLSNRELSPAAAAFLERMK